MTTMPHDDEILTHDPEDECAECVLPDDEPSIFDPEHVEMWTDEGLGEAG